MSMDVEIRFTDGTYENLYEVKRHETDRNSAVITFYADDGWNQERHLGSFPLVNIQKWKEVRS